MTVRIQTRPAEIDWKPIKTAPKDRKRVVCWVPLTERLELLEWFADREQWKDDNGNVHEPSHWVDVDRPR